jgi:hypothetical protein
VDPELSQELVAQRVEVRSADAARPGQIDGHIEADPAWPILTKSLVIIK